MLTVVFALLAAAGLGWGLYQWYRSRRILRRLNEMLSQAVDGSFRERSFDESATSALEARMARFLNGSASASGELARERGEIAALIADISHQTKTPIANLLLYVSLLEEGELTAEQREQVRALRGQAEKLSFLIQALVKSSRLDSGILALTPELRPVAPLLEQAAGQGRAAAEEKGIDLAVEPCAGSARFDPKWTAEALWNVVDNAVKYTPAGGRVTLSAVCYDLFCCIRVADTGPGVAEEEQAPIFSRFYRGRGVREQEGVGLGLYLTREILRREGGYVKVRSRPGEGSVFSLYLPREPAGPGEGNVSKL